MDVKAIYIDTPPRLRGDRLARRLIVDFADGSHREFGMVPNELLDFVTVITQLGPEQCVMFSREKCELRDVDKEPQSVVTQKPVEDVVEKLMTGGAYEEPPKRKRGRPRKHPRPE